MKKLSFIVLTVALTACNQVEKPTANLSEKNLPSVLTGAEPVRLPEAQGIATKQLLRHGISAQSLVNDKISSFPINDLLGLPYGYLHIMDSKVHELGNSQLSKDAITTMTGSSKIRTVQTFQAKGSRYIDELNVTIKALGGREQIGQIVTVDGALLLVQDHQGRFWMQGETQPLSATDVAELKEKYTALALSIANNEDTLKQLEDAWDTNLQNHGHSQPNDFKEFVHGNTFDLNAYIKAQSKAITATAQSQSEVTYNGEIYAGTGYNQNPFKWDGDTLRQGNGKNLPIGCAPSAAQALLHANWKYRGFKMQIEEGGDFKSYDGTPDNKTVRTSGWRPDKNNFYAFANRVVGDNYYMSKLMGSFWFFNGQAVLPSGFTDGLKEYNRLHVRNSSGQVPRLAYTWRTWGKALNDGMYKTFTFAAKDNKPMVMLYLSPTKNDNGWKGGHYAPVKSGDAHLESGFFSSWYNVYVTPVDNSDMRYHISHMWNAFGGLFTLE